MSQPSRSYGLAGRTALVTGGAGFIGSHLVEALVDRKSKVRVLDDFSTGSRSNLESVLSRVELLEGDVRDLATCVAACSGVDLVFHQAALGSVPRSLIDPAATFDVNAQGTANVFAAAREAGAGRVVYASSSSVYGDSPALPKREGEEGLALSPYAASKQMAESIAGLFARVYGLESVGLRYFNIYGPRQDPEGPYAAVIPRFFNACLSSRSPIIHGDGEQSRDFTFVEDAVRANLLAAFSPLVEPTRCFNVAAGRATTVNQLAALIGGITGLGSPPEYRDPRPGDVRHSLADLTRAESELGYRPESDLKSGLRQSLAHFRSLLAERSRHPGADQGAHP